MHLTKKWMVSIIAALMVLLAAGSAFADGEGTVATAKKQTRLMSVTVSPAHLFMPIVELTGEFKAHDQFGLALIGGWGSITAENQVLGPQTFNVWEAGGQFRYYAIGDFDHGMQVGAEVLYLNVSSDNIETSSGTYSGAADGVAAGPFLGYKIATEVGFTFDAQLGYSRVGIGAEATNEDTGQTGEKEASDWQPLLNLNVGWSF